MALPIQAEAGVVPVVLGAPQALAVPASSSFATRSDPMTHRRTLLRQAFVTQLRAAIPSLGQRVYSGRLMPIEEPQLHQATPSPSPD